jgi:hypothetical protein
MRKQIGILVCIVVSAMGVGFSGAAILLPHEQQCECQPPADPGPMPFCELMGSPIGGRLALLPEGAGPHD